MDFLTNNMDFIIIMLSMFIIATVLICVIIMIINDNKEFNITPQPVEKPTTRFNINANDVLNLLNSIDELVIKHCNYKIMYEYEVQQPSYVNTKHFKEMIKEVVLEVDAMLSEDLKQVAYTYYNKEGFIRHLYNTVYPIMMTYSNSKNK